MKKTIVIALGGNAIAPKGKTSHSAQLMAIEKSMEMIVALIEKGYEVVITHGNGPQVGILMEQTTALSLNQANASTEGTIGADIELCLRNALRRCDRTKDIATLVTLVGVDPDAPEMKNPSKPIGVFYSAEEANTLSNEKGWTDAGRFSKKRIS